MTTFSLSVTRFMHRWASLLLALLSFLTLAARPAHTQPTLNIAVLGSSDLASGNADVRAKLLSTGLFVSVNIYDVSTSIPSLTTLKQYNSVLVYADNTFHTALALGNELADYVDTGGGVVVAVFGNATIPLGGRFRSSDYFCLEPGSQTQYTRLTLGNYDASSPLMAGVTSFDGGSASFLGLGKVNSAAQVVASWSNGKL